MERINVVGVQNSLLYDAVKNAVVNIKDKYYFKTDPSIIRINGNYHLLNEDVCLLDKSFYSSNRYTLKSDAITHSNGFFIKAKDLAVLDGKNYHFKEIINLYGKDYHISNPLLVCIDGQYFLRSECINIDGVLAHISNTFKCPVTNKRFLLKNTSKYILIYLYLNNSSRPQNRVRVSIEAFRLGLVKKLFIVDENVNKKYPDSDQYSFHAAIHPNPSLFFDKDLDCYFLTEKNKELFYSTFLNKNLLNIKGDIRGAETYFTPLILDKSFNISKTKRHVGGLNYSFGIEFETCNGILPNLVCETLNLTKVGDGSTRNEDQDSRVLHYEYVTGVLHGNDGLNLAIKAQDLIRSNTEFNKKCSTHIHVGGIKGLNPPVMNRQFSAYCINLGMQIEYSLSLLIPTHRHPLNNRYCASIKNMPLINVMSKESINKGVAAFIFNQSNLSRKTNKKTHLNRWVNSRYKWLNLVNAGSSTGRDTVEFRIFPATKDADYLKMYLLISMAFVYFVENFKHKITSQNNTVFSILSDVYMIRSPKLYNNFILPMLDKMLKDEDNNHKNNGFKVPDSYKKEFTDKELKASSNIILYAKSKKTKALYEQLTEDIMFTPRRLSVEDLIPVGSNAANMFNTEIRQQIR